MVQVLADQAKIMRVYIVQHIKTGTRGELDDALTGGGFTTAQYVKKGSPEGVLRVAFGWEEKEKAAQKLFQKIVGGKAVGAYVIDPYREDIDYMGYKAYDNIQDYLGIT